MLKAERLNMFKRKPKCNKNNEMKRYVLFLKCVYELK